MRMLVDCREFSKQDAPSIKQCAEIQVAVDTSVDCLKSKLSHYIAVNNGDFEEVSRRKTLFFIKNNDKRPHMLEHLRQLISEEELSRDDNCSRTFFLEKHKQGRGDTVTLRRAAYFHINVIQVDRHFGDMAPGHKMLLDELMSRESLMKAIENRFGVEPDELYALEGIPLKFDTVGRTNAIEDSLNEAGDKLRFVAKCDVMPSGKRRRIAEPSTSTVSNDEAQSVMKKVSNDAAATMKTTTANEDKRQTAAKWPLEIDCGGPMTESVEQVLEHLMITDSMQAGEQVDVTTLNALLGVIYTGKCSVGSLEQLRLLYEAAVKYARTNLAGKCAELLGQNLDVENVIGILRLAEYNGVETLRASAIAFVDENVMSLVDDNGATEKLLEHPQMLLNALRTVKRKGYGAPE